MTEASEYLLGLARHNAQAYAALPGCQAILVAGSAAEGQTAWKAELDI